MEINNRILAIQLLQPEVEILVKDFLINSISLGVLNSVLLNSSLGANKLKLTQLDLTWDFKVPERS